MGFIGDGKYKTNKDAISKKVYKAWTRLLKQCYGPNKTGRMLCNKWHNYQVFARWYHSKYKPHSRFKSFVGKGHRWKPKTYSPNTCYFDKSVK